MFLSVHTAFSNVVSLSLFLFSSLQFQGTFHSQDKPEFGMSILEEIFGTRVSDPLNSSWGAESLIAATSISRERNRFGEVFDSSGPPWLKLPCTGGRDVGKGSWEEFTLTEKAPWNTDYILWEQSSFIHQGVHMHNFVGFSDEEDYNQHLYVMSWQELPQMVSPYRPFTLERQLEKSFPITLVLDLDETLVHSSFDICEDADFSFQIHSKMQVQTVFVRQRPYLQMFLEAVSSMFDIVIFTAGQSNYAEQLLDIIDPNRTLICQRVYRDSCVFVNGGYLKDLTILGCDLARIMIVDNTPQVFQLQVENGIPIDSWFGDPEDSALLSLLLFLETLVGADDVRPLIRKKYGRT